MKQPLFGALLATATVALSGQHAHAATSCEQTLLADMNNHQLNYKVSWKGISLNSDRTLHREADGSWTLNNDSRLLFMALEESSHFRYDHGHLTSIAYDYQRKGMSKKRDLSLRFDKPGQVRVISPRGSSELSYKGPIYDLLNHQIQIQLDLACSAPRKQYVYHIVRYGKINRFDYRRVRTETVNTPAGKFDAVLLERRGGDQLDQIWFAPKLDYQIVFMVHHDGNDTSELSLRKLPVKVKVSESNH